MAWSAEQKKRDAKKVGMESLNSMKFSTWTPMNHSPTNDKVFEERRALVGKWFDKWTDSQRKKVLQDIIYKCNKSQLEFGVKVTGHKLPIQKHDFCQILPRCIAVYIFSFLDPRSLCRCAQVSWYWKYVSELDQVWMPKCLRLGWFLTFSPNPYETGIWKRLYLENVREINLLGPKKKPKSGSSGAALTNGHINGKDRQVDFDRTAKKPPRSKTKSGPALEQPPWRASDPVVKDTVRNNYLDNEDDELLRARSKRMQKMMQSRGESDMTMDDPSHSKKLSSTLINYKLKRAKSASNINQRNQRPDWAQNKEGDLSMTSADVALRPAPVHKPPMPVRSSALRSDRDPPSSKPFSSQPWRQPDSYYSDDDDY